VREAPEAVVERAMVLSVFQGNDIGARYRSATFYTSDDQKRIAEDTIADVNASGRWPGRVVTEVVPTRECWEAEPEHQDYLPRIPDAYTCRFVRPGWRLPRRAGSTPRPETTGLLLPKKERPLVKA
jgi:hypothetical protein